MIEQRCLEIDATKNGLAAPSSVWRAKVWGKTTSQLCPVRAINWIARRKTVSKRVADKAKNKAKTVIDRHLDRNSLFHGS